MAVIPLHIVDAFAGEPFSGNPAAIVPNAACLDEAEMVRISEELGMEVGFVLPPEAREADVRLRFFINRREDSLSGHVVIAAFTSLAERGIFRPTPEGRLLHVETLAGVLEVVLTALPDGRTEVALEMPTPRFGEPVPASEVATALDLPTEILKIGGRGPQRVSCGFDHIVVPVGDRDAMRGRFRDFARIQELTDVYGVAGLALMCPETGHDDVDFACRFFHPGDRWCEDVTSGNGLGAVAAYAVHSRLVPPAERMQIVTEQGIALGRPTRAVLNLRMLGEELRSVSIAATGAVVMRGSFQFDRLVRGAVV